MENRLKTVDRRTAAIVALLSRIVIPRLARLWGPRTKQTTRTQNVFLVEYGTPACVLQHELLAEHLRLQGANAERFSTSTILGPKVKYWSQSETQKGKRFASFGEAVSYILTSTSVDYHFQRGVLDEYIRRAPADWLVKDFFVPDVLLDLARNVRAEAESSLRNCSALVLAESSYLKRRALLSVARQNGIPCWILSPKGQWLLIDDSQDEDSVDNLYADTSALISLEPEIVGRAKSYIDKRFKGKTLGDIDAPLVYRHRSVAAGVIEDRKILFLHALRDANQLSLRTKENSEFLPTYLEWTDLAFREISKNPLDWWIKPHPSRFNWPDELKIVSSLLSKHGVPQEILRPDLNTSEVLARRLPVYTHSGTIALEAASLGYRAHVCSSTIPSELSNQSTDFHSFEAAYALDLANAAGSPLDASASELASVILYLKFLRRALKISPRITSVDRSTKSNFMKSLRKQSLQFSRVVCTPSAHRLAASLASEILAVAKRPL
jgi:hypothetical protein